MKHFFKHDFTLATNTFNDALRIQGYTEAMNALVQKLIELTDCSPDKRMVDAVELLDCVSNTNLQLKEYMLSIHKTISENRQTVIENLKENN